MKRLGGPWGGGGESRELTLFEESASAVSADVPLAHTHTHTKLFISEAQKSSFLDVNWGYDGATRYMYIGSHNIL